MTFRMRYLAGIALLALVCLVHELDHRELAREPRQILYQHPEMEAPCREPVVGKELRIWTDKRLSETVGVRTCRVVPIKSGSALQSHWEGVRG